MSDFTTLQPDRQVSVRDTFGIDSPMTVPACRQYSSPMMVPKCSSAAAR